MNVGRFGPAGPREISRWRQPRRVGWGWGGIIAYLDMCEIHVDRDDGKGISTLTYDTTPGYNDTAPFPAIPTRWTYKAIYRVADAQVGCGVTR